MASFTVVEGIDVFGDFNPSLGPCHRPFEFEQLALQRVEERLHMRVVVAVASAAGALDDTAPLQAHLKNIVEELNALIGMEQQTDRLSS